LIPPSKKVAESLYTPTLKWLKEAVYIKEKLVIDELNT
jgi:hypothetical protein